MLRSALPFASVLPLSAQSASRASAFSCSRRAVSSGASNNVRRPGPGPKNANPGQRSGPPSGQRFVPGQIYSPRSLNLENMHSTKPRKAPALLGPSAPEAKKQDPLYQLGLKPGHPSLHDDSYKNPVLLSNYVSEMGKIRPRSVTGLTRRSQREIGKAIRRARSMGLMPIMSRNPVAWTK